MYRKLTNRPGRSLGVLALGLVLAFGSLPLAAMEEITVNGAKEVAQKRAQEQDFKRQMEAYSRAVGEEFKWLLKDELSRAIRGERRLAAVDARSRG